MLFAALQNIKLRFRYRRKQRKALRKWQASGRVAPPPHKIKAQNILEHADKYDINTLVETGTYHGDMVDAVSSRFKKIYSIELSDQYHAAAVARFARQKHIHIIHGDSGEKLGRLVSQLKEPAIFWLDGHYSAGNTARGALDCPVYQELGHILDHQIKTHVILIDDARCFGKDADYPTPDELRLFVNKKNPSLIFSIDKEKDCISITP